MLRGIVVKLRALLRRRSADDELSEELRYHLDRETERNVAAGMTHADARDAARRALGNLTVAADESRDACFYQPSNLRHLLLFSFGNCDRLIDR